MTQEISEFEFALLFQRAFECKTPGQVKDVNLATCACRTCCNRRLQEWQRDLRAERLFWVIVSVVALAFIIACLAHAST